MRIKHSPSNLQKLFNGTQQLSKKIVLTTHNSGAVRIKLKNGTYLWLCQRHFSGTKICIIEGWHYYPFDVYYGTEIDFTSMLDEYKESLYPEVLEQIYYNLDLTKFL